MPLADRDVNGSGRTSRASNISAGSRGFSKGPGLGPSGRSDLLSSTGVQSMLRTSTELGDLGRFSSFDSTQLPSIPRAAPPRRSGASSRMSTASSLSNSSRRASSRHQAWPAAPSAGSTRRSLTRDSIPQYLPDTLSPTIMNLPGSSPLIPRSRSSRDGNRSQSLTHTSQPAFRLSANRSLASLRPREQYQRPRSPYYNPSRLGRRPGHRPGHRPGSPALSDMTITHSRRPTGQSEHSMHSIQSRPRNASASSVHRDDRPHMPRVPKRNRSALSLNPGHGDVPPLPPVPSHYHHVLVEQARMTHTPAKTSVSSGSTNRRTDSDGPSSDAPTPPTPKDGGSMGALVSPAGTRMKMTAHLRTKVASKPLYYDYSEQFEAESYSEPEPGAYPTGFVHRINTIREERIIPETPQKKAAASGQGATEGAPATEVLDIAELPASPIPRRITRDMVLAALDPSSSMEDADTSAMAFVDKTPVVRAQEAKEQFEAGVSATLPQQEEPVGIRASGVSQDGSRASATTVVDSSTLDFAVRYTIPMVTEQATGSDGISALLDGYQHTESNQGTGSGDQEILADEAAEKKSDHAPKSSDEQSFKSCTDLPEEPNNDRDARSFKTCKNVMTPERAVSMAASRLHSANLVKLEPKENRPVSDMPLSSPRTVVRKQSSMPARKATWTNPIWSSVVGAATTRRLPLSSDLPLHHPPPIQSSNNSSSSQEQPKPARESSLSKVQYMFQSMPGFSNALGAAVSTSRSSLNPTHQPPLVPARESSSSKEAQRTQAVADFLVRLSRPRKFSMAHTGFGKNLSKDEVSDTSAVHDGAGQPAPAEQDHLSGSAEAASATKASQVVSTPENKHSDSKSVLGAGSSREIAVAAKENAIPKQTPVKSQTKPNIQMVHQHALSTPSLVVPESSSVYSPEEPHSSRIRTRSSPVVLSNSPAHGRRDSQSTTHLVWNGSRPSYEAAAGVSETRGGRGNGQEETTTDLRLSAYRYPLQYLPNLKEESHEDSSINNSASSLKHSSFRFPSARLSSVRVPGDEVNTFGRNPPNASPSKGDLAQTRGLPSMNFSRMDLFAKVNEVLDVPVVGILEGRPDEIHELASSSPVRPSIGDMREKYRSLFVSADRIEKAGGGNETTTAILGMMPLQRPYSTDQLIAEVEQLTIPDCSALTQRLSEILPSLREYYRVGEGGVFPEEEGIMEHALEALNDVGGPALKRSSARLRALPGSPNLVVVEDDLYEELTGKDSENAKTGRRVDIEGVQEGAATSAAAKDQSPNNTRAREKTPLAELEAPSPVVLRPRSLTFDHHNLPPSVESRLPSRRSLRSLSSTPTATETRPWNVDKNYPWADAPPDISLPPPTAAKTSPRPGHSPLRVSHAPDKTATPEQAPHSPLTTKMSSNKRGSHFDPPESTESLIQPSRPVRIHPEASVRVGERYPTRNRTLSRSLSPVEDEHLGKIPYRGQRRNADSISLVVSDGLGEHQNTNSTKEKLAALGGLKKRITSKKRRADQFELDTISLSSYQDQAAENAAFSTRRQTFSGAGGMSKAQFHGRAFLEGLKRCWHKSAKACKKMYRTLSGRREPLPVVPAHGRRLKLDGEDDPPMPSA